MDRPAFTFINLYIFCNLQRIINKNVTATEHIRGHLSHRYSVMVTQSDGGDRKTFEVMTFEPMNLSTICHRQHCCHFKIMQITRGIIINLRLMFKYKENAFFKVQNTFKLFRFPIFLL
jgi:hypothetical protein